MRVTQRYSWDLTVAWPQGVCLVSMIAFTGCSLIINMQECVYVCGVYICVSMCAFLCVCMYISMCVFLCINMYVCIHVCMCLCVHVYV